MRLNDLPRLTQPSGNAKGGCRSHQLRAVLLSTTQHKPHDDADNRSQLLSIWHVPSTRLTYIFIKWDFKNCNYPHFTHEEVGSWVMSPTHYVLVTNF